MVTRRSFLNGVSAVAGMSLLAGCSEELASDEPDTEGNGGSNTNNNANCRMETRTQKERVVDEVNEVDAGGTLTWNPDLEEGDRVTIEANKISGARPALIVEDDNGVAIAGIGPKSNIRHTFTAESDGRYYIQFENEALLNSGQWDIIIEQEIEYEEKVCN